MLGFAIAPLIPTFVLLTLKKVFEDRDSMYTLGAGKGFPFFKDLPLVLPRGDEAHARNSSGFFH